MQITTACYNRLGCTKLFNKLSIRIWRTCWKCTTTAKSIIWRKL